MISSTTIEPPRESLRSKLNAKPARVAILCDIVEENWPSMDLVGEMLCDQLQKNHADAFAATRLAPHLRRRFTRIRSNGNFFNADRFINRFWDYQRWLQPQTEQFDLFHVIDHSYGQLLHHLPPERTIISCHDLDTFRCLLEPQSEPRSLVFRQMMQHVLNGFRKAARVTCDSAATRDELLAHGLVEPERVVVVANGVHPSCTPESNAAADREAARLLGGPATGAVEILHVGSTIARKRIDLLLHIFAAVRRELPTARLIRVGGPFDPEQERLVAKLGLADSTVVLPRLERNVLASIYRRAAVVLLPSEREGFGLPVPEALACGTNVIASDLPVLREVGGDAAQYCPPGNVGSWAETVIASVLESQQQSQVWRARRSAGINQAARFSWSEYAKKMVGLYEELL